MMQSPAYDIFLEALRQKSPATKKTYSDMLSAYMKHRRFTRPEELLQGTKEEKEDAIKAYLKSISSSMANKAVWALTMFHIANRDQLDWGHIRLFMPRPREKEGDVQKELRPYTKAEIATIWRHADLRQLVATGLMGPGGGIRIGGLPPIKTADLVKLEDYKLYAVKVYSYTKHDAYWTFATPQVSEFIDDYLKKEHKGKSEYLFIDKKTNSGWNIGTDALDSDILRLLKKAGIRSDEPDAENPQANHGFRKFFRTQLEISKIDDESAARLMGHAAWLKKVYSMPDPQKLLELTGYPKAISNLTIPF